MTMIGWRRDIEEKSYKIKDLEDEVMTIRAQLQANSNELHRTKLLLVKANEDRDEYKHQAEINLKNAEYWLKEAEMWSKSYDELTAKLRSLP